VSTYEVSKKAQNIVFIDDSSYNAEHSQIFPYKLPTQTQ